MDFALKYITSSGEYAHAMRSQQDSLKDPKADAVLQPPAQEGALMASTSVFVLEPGQEVGQYLEHMQILFLWMW